MKIIQTKPSAKKIEFNCEGEDCNNEMVLHIQSDFIVEVEACFKIDGKSFKCVACHAEYMLNREAPKTKN